MVDTRIANRRFGGIALRSPSFAYDDFDTADGTSVIGRVSPSGHTWAGTGPGAAACTIQQGRMISTAGNAYMYMQNVGTVYRHACTFSFEPGSPPDTNRANAKIVLLTTQTLDLSGKMLHFQVLADSYIMQQTATGTGGLSAGTFGMGDWNMPLLTDGTVYNVELEIDYVGRSVTIYGPDGSVRTHLFSAAASGGDVGIAAGDLTNVGFQFISSYKVYYHSCEHGFSNQKAHVAAGRSASAGSLGALYGSGFRGRKPFSVKLTGGPNVWHRIVVASNPRTVATNDFALSGRMRLEADDGNFAWNGWEFDCTAVSNGGFAYANPILTHRHGVQLAAGAAITQARLSTSPSFAGPFIALDLLTNASAANPVNVSGEFQGYATIQGSPAVGVTTLDATKLATLTFSNG